EPERIKRLFLGDTPSSLQPTPDPARPPSRSSGALARREGGGGSPDASRPCLQWHLFTTWPMSRYTALRNFKYLAYPFFLQRMAERAARQFRFDLVLSQHAISAVAAGRLKHRLHLPVVMNFLDYLTGFMETWPRYLAPRGCIRALERFELSLPL